MSRHSFTSDSTRRALGVAGIVGFAALVLCSNANVLTRLHIMNTARAEDGLVGALRPRKLGADATPREFHFLLGDEGAMPDLDGAIGWLNAAAAELFGADQARMSIEDWLDELELIDTPPRPTNRDWRAITIAASVRLANRLNVALHRQSSLGTSTTGSQVSPYCRPVVLTTPITTRSLSKSKKTASADRRF